MYNTFNWGSDEFQYCNNLWLTEVNKAIKKTLINKLSIY